eukprot:5316561-Amphidinium_carterae.1
MGLSILRGEQQLEGPVTCLQSGTLMQFTILRSHWFYNARRAFGRTMSSVLGCAEFGNAVFTS